MDQYRVAQPGDPNELANAKSTVTRMAGFHDVVLDPARQPLMQAIMSRLAQLDEELSAAGVHAFGVRERLLGTWPVPTSNAGGASEPKKSQGDEVLRFLEGLIERARTLRETTAVLSEGL